MRIAYGFDDVEKNKTLIHSAETLVLEHSKAAVPGRYLVNYFPFLDYSKLELPSWFPGAGFKRRAEKIKEEEKQYLQYLYETGKRTVSSLQRWLPVVRTDST